MEYETVFESDNIIYTKMTEKLLEDYLKMYNNREIQSENYEPE